jgi:hypothetical protein
MRTGIDPPSNVFLLHFCPRLFFVPPHLPMASCFFLLTVVVVKKADSTYAQTYAIFDYRIYSRISRPAYKSNWKKYHAKSVQNYKNILCVKSIISKNTNFETTFYDPHISRIDKILPKFCPKFLNLYASIYGNF